MPATNVLSTEQALLVHCAKMQCHAPAPAGAGTETFLQQGIRWDHFLTLAIQNRVSALVYKSLSKVSPGLVPADTLHALHVLTRQTAAQNMRQLNRLKQLLAAFEKRGIPVIPFKGAALAFYYPNLGLREWTDTDIIIRKEQVYEVQRVLFEQGFVCARQPGNHRLEDHLRWSHSFSYIHPQDASLVDVHWALADRKDGVYHDMEPIWEKCSTKNFFNLRVCLPGTDDTLLALCIHHGVRSGWNQLRYICDLVMVLRAGNIQWERVLAASQSMGISRTLLVGLSLAQEWFDMPPAPELQHAIKHPMLEKLKLYVCSEMWNKSDAAAKHFYSLAGNIGLRESFSTRFYLYRHLGMDIMRFVIKKRLVPFFRSSMRSR